MARIQHPPGAARRRAPSTDTRHPAPARAVMPSEAGGRLRTMLQHVTRYVGEPGTLEAMTVVAADWFARELGAHGERRLQQRQ